MFKEGWISLISGSGDGVPGCYRLVPSIRGQFLAYFGKRRGRVFATTVRSLFDFFIGSKFVFVFKYSIGFLLLLFKLLLNCILFDTF